MRVEDENENDFPYLANSLYMPESVIRKMRDTD